MNPADRDQALRIRGSCASSRCRSCLYENYYSPFPVHLYQRGTMAKGDREFLSPRLYNRCGVDREWVRSRRDSPIIFFVSLALHRALCEGNPTNFNVRILETLGVALALESITEFKSKLLHIPSFSSSYSHTLSFAIKTQFHSAFLSLIFYRFYSETCNVFY